MNQSCGDAGAARAQRVTIAKAPPRTLTLFGSAFRSLITDRVLRGEGFIDFNQVDVVELEPGRSKALCVAGTGPMPITEGSTPATAMALFSLLVSDHSLAFFFGHDEESRGANVIGLALPAVTCRLPARKPA